MPFTLLCVRAFRNGIMGVTMHYANLLVEPVYMDINILIKRGRQGYSRVLHEELFLLLLGNDFQGKGNHFLNFGEVFHNSFSIPRSNGVTPPHDFN